jgi:hypothetical protein
MVEEHQEDSERLLVQADPGSVLAKFAGANVEFEGPEANDPGPWKCRTHVRCPVCRMLTL